MTSTPNKSQEAPKERKSNSSPEKYNSPGSYFPNQKNQENPFLGQAQAQDMFYQMQEPNMMNNLPQTPIPMMNNQMMNQAQQMNQFQQAQNQPMMMMPQQMMMTNPRLPNMQAFRQRTPAFQQRFF
jgi:hypothetical protein